MRARPILPVLPVLVVLAAVLVAAPARPAAAAQGGPRVVARHAILVDADAGEVLWGRGSRTPRPPASLTKMLTALAVRASLELDGRVAASRVAARQPARRLAVGRGQWLTVEQALKALMIVSANDVAVMLAEGAAGSVGRFARAMDAESERLGLRQSRWRNPHGLDAPGHRSSAFDLAILARAMLRDREKGSRVTKTTGSLRRSGRTSVTREPFSLARVVRTRRTAFTSPSGRRHTLTARSRFLLGYRGAVGVKTGLTDDAGHCLAAAATRHGRTLIAVVLDSPDTAADAGQLLDWGFGRGRVARTGLRLPAYVAPAGVAALLVRPPRMPERHRPLAPRAAAGTAGGGPSPDGPAARRSWPAGARAATGAGATAALLAATGLVLRRRRRGLA
jgi:serine-type D-Ala-D-Ala carboxypeptidase (penicillin-binding protein 5/6)